MKRFIALVIAMLLFTIPLTANAIDVKTDSRKTVYTNEDTTIPFRIVVPQNYDESKSYPMLVFFHGAGERGNDNELSLFHCIQYLADNLPECFILVPQCPLNNQWVDTPWANGAYSVDNIPESNELKAVVEYIQSLCELYSIDTDRIYASGISMGGFATWDVMMRHNDIFAAAIAVCGGGDISKGELLKDTPMFVFHAVDDTAVPVSGSRESVKAIQNAGGTLVEYTEYTTGGHGIWNQAFATEGLLDKLLECRLSDRYPELKEESSEAVASEEESKLEEKKSGFINARTITLAASVLIAAVVMTVAYVVKKKKKK